MNNWPIRQDWHLVVCWSWVVGRVNSGATDSPHLLLRWNLLLRTGETTYFLPNNALPVTNVAYFLPKQEILNRMATIIITKKYLAVLQFTVATPGGSKSQTHVAGTLYTHVTRSSDIFRGNTKTIVWVNLAIQSFLRIIQSFPLILKGKSIRLYSKFKMLVLFNVYVAPWGGNLIPVALASKEASLLAWSGQGWCFYRIFSAHILHKYSLCIQLQEERVWNSFDYKLYLFSHTGARWLASLASLSIV